MGLLSEKICLVTGANRGIGAEIVRRYTEEGAVVYAVARRKGSLDVIARSISDNAGDMIPLYFDVTDSDAAKQAILRIKKDQGRLDVLVNNAGIMEDALIGMISRDLINRIFTTNVYATIEMMQFATKLMKRQNAGSIINFSSIVGVEGNPGQTVYSASKGAVIAATKTAAKELAPFHVQVNAVAPGMIGTDMFYSMGKDRVDDYVGKIGYGRLGEPAEVADVCVFLASDLSRYVTGQVIGVNGSAVV